MLGRVLGVSHANQCCFEKTDDRCENFLTGQSAPGEIAGDSAPDSGQGAAKGNHAVILGRIANFSPIFVVPKLFTAPSIAPRGLEMTVFAGANPNRFPRRGDRKAPDSVEKRAIPNPLSPGIDIIKFLLLSLHAA